MWHHLVLLDSWCVENQGAESMIFPGSSDTAFPQCSNDSCWAACEFAPEGPPPSTAFTDMTAALVRYELAAVSMTVLERGLAQGEAKSYLQYHHDLLLQSKASIEGTYLTSLDTNQASQKIVKDLTALAFERMYFAIHQPLFKHGKGGEMATPQLQSELFDRAIGYCETVQQFQEEYEPHHLDWVFVCTSFSWHSVTIMLTSILSHSALEPTTQGQRARARIDRLFQHRQSIDYLAGNSNLWKPLQQLYAELQSLGVGGSGFTDPQPIVVLDDWSLGDLGAEFS